MVRNSKEGRGAAEEYREAMLHGASLAWEERWEAAAAAYRRALAARPGDQTAERQLSLALGRLKLSAGQAEHVTPLPGPPPQGRRGEHRPDPVAASSRSATPSPAGSQARVTGTADEAVFGRTASAHLAELAALPHDLVRKMIEGMRAIEHDQAAGRYSAALDGAYTLLLQAPTFLPLHILLADIYTEAGQWQAAHEKLGLVDAAYAARAAHGSRRAGHPPGELDEAAA